MKIAYLILAHDNPQHLGKLVEALSSPYSGIFIHLDRRSNMDHFRGIAGGQVCFSQNRVPVFWGEFSIVEATLILLQQAFSSMNHFDYFVLLSGSDYPLHGQAYIQRFFEHNRGKEYLSMFPMPCEAKGKPLSRIIVYRLKSRNALMQFAGKVLARLQKIFKLSFLERDYKAVLGALSPYAGSQWWALSREACQYVLSFIKDHAAVVDYFANTRAPDEMFFHTILANSPFKTTIQRSLTYSDWSAGESRPSAIRQSHVDFFESALRVQVNDLDGEGEVLFARKFSDQSKEVVEKLDVRRNREDAAGLSGERRA